MDLLDLALQLLPTTNIADKTHSLALSGFSFTTTNQHCRQKLLPLLVLQLPPITSIADKRLSLKPTQLLQPTLPPKNFRIHCTKIEHFFENRSFFLCICSYIFLLARWHNIHHPASFSNLVLSSM